jgi:hypothetical protein
LRKLKVRNLWIQDGINHSVNVSTVLNNLYDGVIDFSTAATTAISISSATTTAISITGATTTALRIDLNYDFSTTADYPKAIYVTQDQTGEHASGGGGLQGIRCNTDNNDYNNLWQVSVQGRAMVSNATINDAIGVYASIDFDGTVTRYAASSSLSAFKGDVSDTAGATWNAQVYGIMLSYASQIDCGGDTALFFGYTHGTARCDYGFKLDNYSPNMVAGIWLTDTAGATPAMDYGINIDAASTTAIKITGTHNSPDASHIWIDANYDIATIDDYPCAIYVDCDQTSENGDDSGGMQGIRCDVNNAGFDNLWQVSVQGRQDVTGPAKINDAIGIYGSIKTTGALTKYATESSFAALKGDISNASTGSWDAQVYNLMLSFGSAVNYGGNTALIYGYTHGDARCDYGLNINNYSPYMTAGIYIEETSGSSPAMTDGIKMTAAGIGTMINMGTPTSCVFKMVADDTIVSDANQSILKDISATANAGFIKVILDTSTVKYIALYDLKAA